MRWVARVTAAVRVVRALWPIVRAAVEAQEDEAKPGSEKLAAAVEASYAVAQGLLAGHGYQVGTDQMQRVVAGLVELVLIVRVLRGR